MKKFNKKKAYVMGFHKDCCGVKVYAGQAFIVDRTPAKEPKEITSNPYTLEDGDHKFILESYYDVPLVIVIPNGLPPLNRYEGKQLGDGQVQFSGSIIPSDTEEFRTLEKTSVWGLDNIGNDEYVLYGQLALK